MQNKKRDDTATLTAKACRCTPQYVRMIVKGTRRDLTPTAQKVLQRYNSILATKEQLSQVVDEAAHEHQTE